jgi:RimJ/RimL family protein N-acetyltransferase
VTVPAAPRLVGPRVALVPVAGHLREGPGLLDDPSAVLAGSGLRPGPGWPHEDTAAALVGTSLPAPDPDEPTRTWLVVVDGAVVGECGWKGPPGDDGAVEIGYGLAAPSRGLGLGTEAVAVLVAWTERQHGVRAVTAEVSTGNQASRRLLRRLGFAEDAPRDGHVLARRGQPRLRGRHVC